MERTRAEWSGPRLAWALIEGYRAASEGETRFVVINPTTSFRRVLTVTGLSDLFGLTESMDTSGTSFAPTEATGA